MFCFKTDECLVPRSWSVNNSLWTSHAVYFRESLRIIRPCCPPMLCGPISWLPLSRLFQIRALQAPLREVSGHLAEVRGGSEHRLLPGGEVSRDQGESSTLTPPTNCRSCDYIIIYTSPPAGQCKEINCTRIWHISFSRLYHVSNLRRLFNYYPTIVNLRRLFNYPTIVKSGIYTSMLCTLACCHIHVMALTQSLVLGTSILIMVIRFDDLTVSSLSSRSYR